MKKHTTSGPGATIGDTADFIRHGSGWGAPRKINRTESQYEVREQWVYGRENYLYFKNDILVSIQTSVVG